MNYFPNPKWEARKAAIARGEPVEHSGRVPLPCTHIGDVLRAGAMEGLGLDTRRRWRLCNRGYVAAVCDCTEGRDPWCGPQCPGYQTA